MSQLIFADAKHPDMPHSHMLQIGGTRVPTEYSQSPPAGPNLHWTHWNGHAWAIVGRLPPWKYPAAKNWVAERCTMPMYCTIKGSSDHHVDLFCGDGAFRCFQFNTYLETLQTYRLQVNEEASLVDDWMRDNCSDYVIQANNGQVDLWIGDEKQATAAALRFEQQPTQISG